MSLRMITGRSGQGKTQYLVNEVIRRSAACPKQKFYVIVPEQFSLEMQRDMVKKHPRHGFFHIDVLSFHRLAYRIFQDCGHRPKDILEDLGISLVLRKILSERENELLFFKKSMKNPGFIDKLKSMMIEFISYGVSWNQIKELPDQLEKKENLQNKCRELGTIYEDLVKTIEGRFMVTEQILDVAGQFVDQAPMLKDAVFYLDGFTGFTPVQLKFIKQLLIPSAQINIAVTAPVPQAGRPLATEDFFCVSEKMMRSLVRICRESNTKIEESTVLDAEVPLRFTNNPEMAFLEKNIFQSKWKRWDKPTENIHLTVCHNPEGEAEYVMHKIEELVRRKGYRYRDFAVLSGDITGYSSSFVREAERLDIPIFEDVKKKVSYHSGIEVVRALFHLVLMDYSYESVFRYLKSGMSDFSDEETDYLENYVLYAGIRGYSMWKKPFVRRIRQKEESEVAKLQELREKMLQETENFYLCAKGKEKTVREKMTALYETMVALKFQEKLSALSQKMQEQEEHGKAREYEQLYSLLLSLMDKIVAIFGDEKMPLKELSEMVDSGLESLGLGVPPLSMDQVVLGDLKRTRLHEIKVLFVTGVNDGKIPPDLEDRGILSEEEKEVLKQCGISLSQNMLEQSMEDEFSMYLAFSKPSDELFFTYSVTDRDGKALRPSSLQKRLQNIFPGMEKRRYPKEERRYYFHLEDSREFLLENLKEIQQNPEKVANQKAFWMLLKYWYESPETRDQLIRYLHFLEQRRRRQQLPESLMEALYGRQLTGSVTRLESFAACPYQYYCTYGLELKEREEYHIRPLDLGNVFHRALEYFSRKVKESPYNWKNLPDEIQEEYISDALYKAFDDNLKDVFRSSSRNQYKINTVKRILERTIQILRVHLQNSKFEPDQFELRFGGNEHLKAAVFPLSKERKMILQGKIDRIDICEEESQVFLRIIDYKSGRQKFEIEDFYYGLELQLFLYLNAAEEIYEKEKKKPVIPAGVFYYQLKDPIVKSSEKQEDLWIKNFRMSGLANSEKEILSRLENGEKGFLSAPIRLKKNGDPYKNAPVADTESFFAMGDYVDKKVRELGERIYQGEIQASPYKNRRGSACDYCPYVDVCGFDPRLFDYRYREFQGMSAEEVREKIREEDR